jgi:hypothetical protein
MVPKQYLVLVKHQRNTNKKSKRVIQKKQLCMFYLDFYGADSKIKLKQTQVERLLTFKTDATF